MTWKVRPESGLDSDTCGTLAGPSLGEDTAGSWRARGRLRLGTERRVCVAGVLMAPCLGGELPMRTLCGACTAGVAAPPPRAPRVGRPLGGVGVGRALARRSRPPLARAPLLPPGAARQRLRGLRRRGQRLGGQPPHLRRRRRVDPQPPLARAPRVRAAQGGRVQGCGLCLGCTSN